MLPASTAACPTHAFRYVALPPVLTGLQMGPKAANLAVADPQRYAYDADAVLLHMVRLSLRLAAADISFAQALASDPDFSSSFMVAAAQRLSANETNTEARHCAPRFEDLLQKVCDLTIYRTQTSNGHLPIRISRFCMMCAELSRQGSVAIHWTCHQHIAGQMYCHIPRARLSPPVGA